MSIDRETLMAYADGQLGPEDRIMVEAAIAADPDMARDVEAHQALRAQLGAHFAPIASAPVPERLKAVLGAPSNVVDMATVRKEKEERVPLLMPSRRWGMMGGAIAASLALGMVMGTQLRDGGPVATQDGRLIAQGKLDRALTSQLASAPSADAPVRILLSFRAAEGNYCRAFETDGTAGIACRSKDAWAIAQMQSGVETRRGGYRQAGSAHEAIMAAAQEMAADGALDAEAERAARMADWGD